MFEPILEWADEEPIEQILERYKIMTGDLFSIRDSLERMITFVGIIASSLSITGYNLQDKLTNSLPNDEWEVVAIISGREN